MRDACLVMWRGRPRCIRLVIQESPWVWQNMAMTVRVCGSLDHGGCAPRDNLKKTQDIRPFPNHCRLDRTPHRIASFVWSPSWHVRCLGRRFAHHHSKPMIMSSMNLARMWTKLLTLIPTHHAIQSRKLTFDPVPTRSIRMRNKRVRIWTMSVVSQCRV